MSYPAASFGHLQRLTDDVGLLEHAEGIVPRHEHGYCVDDVARGLVVVCREPSPQEMVAVMSAISDVAPRLMTDSSSTRICPACSTRLYARAAPRRPASRPTRPDTGRQP
jgi:hypothetical protein